jgi:hypothetical protein
MSIHIPKDHIVRMPDGQDHYVMQILTLRHACKLESLGLRRRRRRTACAIARDMLRLPKNTSRETVAEVMEDVVRQIKEAMS